MIDYSYGDYYRGLLTGTPTGGKIDITNDVLIEGINNGLSSVKIAKELGVSYGTILNKVDKQIPVYSEALRENGRQNMIRMAIK